METNNIITAANRLNMFTHLRFSLYSLHHYTLHLLCTPQNYSKILTKCQFKSLKFVKNKLKTDSQCQYLRRENWDYRV
jgi:hypothetical protein